MQLLFFISTLYIYCVYALRVIDPMELNQFIYFNIQYLFVGAGRFLKQKCKECGIVTVFLIFFQSGNKSEETGPRSDLIRSECLCGVYIFAINYKYVVFLFICY